MTQQTNQKQRILIYFTFKSAPPLCKVTYLKWIFLFGKDWIKICKKIVKAEKAESWGGKFKFLERDGRLYWGNVENIRMNVESIRMNVESIRMNVESIRMNVENIRMNVENIPMNVVNICMNVENIPMNTYIFTFYSM